MSNPFYVQPLGGLDVAAGIDELRQQHERKKAQEAQQERLQEARRIFDSGDNDAMASFMVSNPDLAQTIHQAQGFKSDATRKNMAESAFKFLTGQGSAQDVARERARMVVGEGGDPSDTVAWANAAPEQQRNEAKMALMFSDPKLYQSFRQFEQDQNPEKTSDIKEFEFARSQGFEGSFVDFIRSQKKGVNVTVNNSNGRQQPTKSVKSQIQKDVLAAQKELRNLRRIASAHSSDFLTTAGRAKAMVGSVLDKMDSNAFGLADFNAQRARFSNAARQMFNQYRKEITGAAAGEKEMQALLDSMFNESQGPREFKETFDLFMDSAMENLSAAQENAREGIEVTEKPALSDAELFKKYGIQ